MRLSLLQCCLLLSLVAMAGHAAEAQETDSTLVRVQRLVNAGDRAAARAVANSVLASTPTGSGAHAEALFARAFASSNAADAERDYLRVTIEYPLSPRAEDALMMVAQLRLARGDRNGARRQFERMVREHPTGTQVAKASFWAGRLALEAGDAIRGCPSLAIAREHLNAGDIELGNQIDYYRARCAGVPSVASLPDTMAAIDTAAITTAKPPATPTSKPSVASATRPATRPPVTAATRPPRTSPAPVPTPVVTPDSANPPASAPVKPVNTKQFSVQVAAFPKKRDADALGEVLQQRGFQVRVFGTAPPFRVRVGRYDSREEASAALERMKAARLKGIIVEAEPQ